jgi:hypothetical protein
MVKCDLDKAYTVADAAIQGVELLCTDVAHAPGHLLDAGDLLALAGSDRLDEVDGVEHRLAGAGVEPGRAPTEPFHA